MHEIIGWMGSFFYIIAYFLLSIRKLRPDHLMYQLLNICGGACLIVYSLRQDDYPAFLRTPFGPRLAYSIMRNERVMPRFTIPF